MPDVGAKKCQINSNLKKYSTNFQKKITFLGEMIDANVDAEVYGDADVDGNCDEYTDGNTSTNLHKSLDFYELIISHKKLFVYVQKGCRNIGINICIRLAVKQSIFSFYCSFVDF